MLCPSLEKHLNILNTNCDMNTRQSLKDFETLYVTIHKRTTSVNASSKVALVPIPLHLSPLPSPV